MKLPMWFVLCSIFSFPQPLLAQDTENDPLAEARVIQYGGGEEIIDMNYEYVSGDYEVSIEVSKYYEAMSLFARDTVIRVLTYSEPVDEGSLYNASHITLEVNDDDMSEIVAAWENNGAIEIAVLRADPSRLGIDSIAQWDKVTRFTKSDPAWFKGEWWLTSPPLLAAGDFTADGTDEFALAYWATDGGQNTWLHLILYDVDDSLGVTELAHADWPLPVPPSPSQVESYFNIFVFTSADFDDNGKEELLLTGRVPMESGGWELQANVYSYQTGIDSLVRFLSEVVYARTDTLYDVLGLEVASGNLNDTGSQQVVIHLNQIPTVLTRPDTSHSYLIGLAFDEDLSTINVSEPYHRGAIIHGGHLNTDMILERGDIDGDGLAEIISGGSYDRDSLNPSLAIYRFDDQLHFNRYADLDPVVKDLRYHTIGLGYVMRDTSHAYRRPELILSGFEHPIGYYTNIYTIDLNPDGEFKAISLRARGPVRLSAFTTADLDADIRLGQPRRSSITKILQPLVILNAPPAHFDMFAGEIFDVSKMYNLNEGKFISTYSKESSQATELQTELNKDWGLSGTLSTDHSFFGVSVSSHLTASYGEKFSKEAGSSSTVTVNISVDAVEDDRIYATVLDYNVWEYPVYGNGVEKGHVLVVEPVMVENRWFPSKSWSGYSYIPEHEVGNILSYREYPRLSDNPVVDEKIKGDHNNSFVLDGNSSYDWSLQFDDFQSTGATTQKEFGVDWGASISGWGVSLEVDGYYSQEQIQTQRTSVSQGLFLGVHLDALDLSLGEVSYRVTPYAYWATNGALVVDYAVQPELAQQGFTDTWWQVYYNDHADPAFIMPWRYDPEKGFTLEDPVKRLQTKDITFTPENTQAGDTVAINVRVHNFSLIPTPQPVGVSFYVGDPDDGGTVIEDINGNTVIYTNGIVPSRGSQTVKMKMVIPGDLGAYPRIYAVIDPLQSMVEVHNNNNKGWSILGKSSSTNIEKRGEDEKPLTFSLEPNYPNPFNPATTIRYSISEPDIVTLSIYNIIGQRVETLVSEKQAAGMYEYQWNANGFASGLYFYRLSAGAFTQTRKMMVVK